MIEVSPRWDPARVRTLRVDVLPGAVVPVFYVDPASRFFGGSLGTRYRRDWMLRLLQASGVVVVLCMLVALVRT